MQPRILLCSFSFLVFLQIQAQDIQKLTIQPNALEGEDAMVLNRTDMIDANFGTDPSLFVDGWTGYDHNSDENDGRSLIRFSHLDSLVGTNVSILSATLILKSTVVRRFPSSGDNAGKIYLLNQGWAENSVTWNTQPTFLSNQFVAVPAIAQDFDSVIVDVSDLVGEIVKGTVQNFGFIYKLDNEDPYNSIEFASSDYGDPSRRPKLVVEYTTLRPSAQLILQPDANIGFDAMVLNRTDMIDSNFGTDPSLFVDGWTGYDHDSDENDGRSLVRFIQLDPLIGRNSLVINAQLILHSTVVRRFASSGDNAGKIYLLNQNWAENTVTWNTQPAYLPSPFVQTPPIAQDFDSVVINVTSLVQKLLDGDVPNFGFLYKLDNEDPYNSIEFASSDYANPARRPKLIVNYTVQMVTDVSSSLLSTKNSVYPNPALTELFINDAQSTESFSILDASGIEVVSGKEQVDRIDVSQLKQGMYLIRLKTKTGVSSQKFLKQ
jgi:hypothetical protein